MHPGKGPTKRSFLSPISTCISSIELRVATQIGCGQETYIGVRSRLSKYEADSSAVKRELCSETLHHARLWPPGGTSQGAACTLTDLREWSGRQATYASVAQQSSEVGTASWAVEELAYIFSGHGPEWDVKHPGCWLSGGTSPSLSPAGAVLLNATDLPFRSSRDLYPSLGISDGCGEQLRNHLGWPPRKYIC